MASNAISSLSVLLGLDASEYVKGLTKAERQAQQFAANTRAALIDIAKFVGALEIGRELINATKQIIDEAAALNDLAGSTGSTVEQLSRLTNQAKIAGADLATVQQAVLRLSSGMAGADDETSKVRETLKLLGITTKDPVQALQEVAVKLDTYADGVNKVGLAQALFGKQGLQFLATLKDIAELQDVGATITARQAQEAEALQQQIRRLSVETEGFKNLILSGLVPALRDMISQFSEGIRVAGGFVQALRLLSQIDTGDLAGETRRIADAILHAQEVIARNQALFGNGDLFGGQKALDNLGKQLQFMQALARQRGLASISPLNNDTRDIRAALIKPEAPPPPADSKKIKESVSEAQRYLEALEKTLERTQDLTTVEQFLRDVQLNRIKGLTPALTEEILKVAQEIDAFKALTKEIEDGKKAWEEETRAMQDNLREKQASTRAAQDVATRILEQNEALRDEIAIILGGEGARKALELDHVNTAISMAEETRALRALQGAQEDELKALDLQIAALREREELLKGRSFAEALKKDAQALQDVKNLFADALVNPLADFVTGTKSAKEAFRSLVDDITRQLARIAAQGVANSLFGGNTSNGPDVFGVLAKLLGAYFGGGAGGGGGGVPGVGFSGGGFGEHFATGTPYAPGGWATVGEHGPERMYVPPGAQVKPHGRTYGYGGEIHAPQTFNFYGPMTNQSARQMKQAARDGVMSAIRDR